MPEAFMQIASEEDHAEEEQVLIAKNKASKVRLAVIGGAALTIFCTLALLGMMFGSRAQPDGSTSRAREVLQLAKDVGNPCLLGPLACCRSYPDQYDSYDDKQIFGASDVDNDRCSFYKAHVHQCGKYDDWDFVASEMCCACGGGSTYRGKRSLALNKASVFISGNAECPRGTQPITTLSGCRAALDLVGYAAHDYNGASSEADWPKGCYYCKNVHGCGNGFWFNTDKSGGVQKSTQRVCHKHYDVDKAKILFVGDSDIDYWDTSAAFPGSMNVGVGGYTTEDVIKEVDTWVEELDPEWVVLVCGENDFEPNKRGITKKTLKRFKTIASKFIKDGARVIYLGTKPEPDSKNLFKEYGYYDAKLRTWVAEQAQGKDFAPIQMIDVFKSFTTKNSKKIYNTDKLHMSRMGYKFWNGWVKIAMESKAPCVLWQDGVCVEMAK